MKAKSITLLGLGPGDPNLLTREAWLVLQNATEVYLRTCQHTTVASFPKSLQVHCFDHLYEQFESYEEVYNEIVTQVLALGDCPGGVIYAVPGHPFVAESTSLAIYHRAKTACIPVRVCEGLSFIEPVFTALEIDPFPQTSLVDALTLLTGHHPTFPPSTPALIAQIYDSHIAAEVKLTLMNLYPDEHPVNLVHASGTSKMVIEAIPLYQIDRSPYIGLTTVLYLPPLARNTSFEELQEIAAHLRAPEGCPWDQIQTYQSMQPHLMEEAYELLAAIDGGKSPKISEELGDLMMVITMLMQIGSESRDFTSADVFREISTKLVYRHPHVFENLKVDGEQMVLRNWEKLKAEEREENGEAESGLLEGVSIALPALTQAQEYQNRVARVGFDWHQLEGVVEKVLEELAEVRNTSDDSARTAEVGDLLFAIVNLSRWYGVDAEGALRVSSARFQERFSYIERTARAQGRELSSMTLEEMDALWNEAKSRP